MTRDSRFGRIAIELGFIVEGQLEEALAEQRRLHEAGEETEVGQILLARNQLTHLQFLEILAIQRQIPWICRPCATIFDTREVEEGRCPRCGRALEIPSRRG